MMIPAKIVSYRTQLGSSERVGVLWLLHTLSHLKLLAVSTLHRSYTDDSSGIASTRGKRD